MTFNKEEIENIKSTLTFEQIYHILDFFKGSPIKQNHMIISKTICHGGDSHKLYYYDNTKLFKCYTGCGADAFDVYELIIKIYHQKNKIITVNQAIMIISEILHLNFKFHAFVIKTDSDDIIEKQKKILALGESEKIQHSNYEYNIYDDGILNHLDKVIVKEWFEEGISIQSHEQYNIKYFPPARQIIIPHYSIDNQLIGIRGRFLDDENVLLYGKYKPVFIQGTLYSHPLSFSLYGLNFSKEAIKKTKKAIIFESEKSVMMYNSYFGKDNNISVACCGSSISKFQIQMLLDLGVNEIIIALDRQYKTLDDAENKKYLQNIFKIIDKIYNYCNVSIIYDKQNLLNYKDSPIDRGANTFIDLFQKRILINENIINYYGIHNKK